MSDPLEWSCHVCGEMRPDHAISVAKRMRPLTSVVMTENLRYCNDREECASAAVSWQQAEEPKGFYDGIPIRGLRSAAAPERERPPVRRSPLWLLIPGFILVAIIALVLAGRGEAHLAYKVRAKEPTQEQIHAVQTRNLHHARYVCRRGGGQHRQWACRAAEGWLLREWRATRPEQGAWWVEKQIRIAEKLGAEGDRQNTDPWPNCPDPYDHRGHSWIDTLACENVAFFQTYGPTDPRSWLDPPGYYRCGLQFKPSWEDKYGRLCP